jgi:hypothetical protein
MQDAPKASRKMFIEYWLLEIGNIKFKKLLWYLLAQLFSLSSIVYPQSSFIPGERYALIIGGLGGQTEFTQKYFQQTSRLYDLLVDSLKYDRKNILYLFENTDYDSSKINYAATAENVRRAFAQLAESMKSNDQLFIFMVGHGTYDGDWCKFNLVGPDLRDIDFAKFLSELPTKKIILVNTSSASGPFIEKLSGEQRVIITATKSGREHFETNFTDFFLNALTSEQADVNKDRRISIVEAFKFAKTRQDAWFAEKRQIRAEHPLLDDNGDGSGSEELDGKADGQLASRIYLGAISAELETTIKRAQTGASSPADNLLLKKAALEQEIEELKAKKSQLKATEYAQKLEALLIELARVNQELKKLQK